LRWSLKFHEDKLKEYLDAIAKQQAEREAKQKAAVEAQEMKAEDQEASRAKLKEELIKELQEEQKAVDLLKAQEEFKKPKDEVLEELVETTSATVTEPTV